MADLLLPHAQAHPEKPALIDDSGITTWEEFNLRVDRLIHVLRTAGLKTGDTVGMLMGNRREVYEVLAACAHSGLLAVPINWHFQTEEIAYVLDNAGCRALIVGHRFADAAAAALARDDGTQDHGDRRSDLILRLIAGDAERDGFLSYDEALAAAPADPPSEQGEGSVMFYTSGTTGRPKGVRRLSVLGGSLDAVRMQGFGFSMMMGLPVGGTTLLCGPYYHSAQWAFSYFPLCAGSTIIIQHKFDAAVALELIDRHSVTNTHLVPTQMIRLLALDDEIRQRFDGSSLVVALHGAAPCSPETKRRMIDWWGPRLVEYYGGTEGAVISLLGSRDWQDHPTSVGKPLPSVEVHILDEDGTPMPTGQEGQIYLKSLFAADFEYHGERDKTAAVHRSPGIFTMGDIGFLDAEGFLYLTDRKIDMIVSGGVNVYPAEIERVLGDHPRVADVAVIGVPDDEFGERVLALVQLADEAQAGDDLERELIEFCRASLAGYKVPRSVEFRLLPRTATGKLSKKALREPYWQGHQRRI